MTKLELLNVFLNERLTAAAEEIFRAVKDTMVEYQSEIIRSKEENERLKRLLNIAVQRLLLHPEPNSIQPQEAAPSSELQHCDQDWAISLSQEEPEPPPRIKEEPLEHRNTENEEQRPPSEFDTKGLTSPSYSDVVCSDVDQPPQRLLVPSLQPNGDSNSLPAAPSKDIKVENDREELITCQRSSVSPPLRIYSNFAGALCDSRGDASEANRATPRREKAPGREASLSKGPPPNGANGKPSAAHVLRVKNAKPLPSRHSPHPAQGMQKWHSCRECGKCFSFACQLEVHTRWHTKEKPYSCAVCRKSFTTVSMLKRHHRIHTGEKPFRCHVCGKCFNQSAHLNTHFRLHTGERARWARVAHPAK